jgi:hypothetical protein
LLPVVTGALFCPMFAPADPATSSEASVPESLPVLPGSPAAPFFCVCRPGAFCETPEDGGKRLESAAAPVVLDEPELGPADGPPLLPP